MAVRLSVLMIHTPPAGSGQQELSESIVGELIGRAGIDVMLIGPIETLAESSTDRLTLDTLSGDFALLDWQPAAESVAALAKIGFEGIRAAHANDPHPPENGHHAARRIFALDLIRFSEASEVVDALVELRDHRRVKTVSIDLAPQPRRPTPQPTPEPQPKPREPVSTPPSPVPSPPTSAAKPSPTQTKASDSIDLDDLLNQLDQLDP